MECICSVTNRLRESLILEYGWLVGEHRSLWAVGAAYLAGCGPAGRRRAACLLETVPLRSEGQALRVLAEANKHGLSDVGEATAHYKLRRVYFAS